MVNTGGETPAEGFHAKKKNQHANCAPGPMILSSMKAMARWLHGHEPDFKHEISRRHSVDNSPKLIGNKDKRAGCINIVHKNKTLDNSPNLVTGGLGCGGCTHACGLPRRLLGS